MEKFTNFVAELFENEPKSALKKQLKAAILKHQVGTVKRDLIDDIDEAIAASIAGSRDQLIKNELLCINNDTVKKNIDLLTAQIRSSRLSVRDRRHMTNLWKQDRLIDIDLLVTPGARTLSDITRTKNPAVLQFLTDLLAVSSLGHGRGEFALTALSTNIVAADKGDLSVAGSIVEMKTNYGGSGRFTDQDVSVGVGYTRAAAALTEYLANSGQKTPRSGLNIKHATEIASNNKKFVPLLHAVVSEIFHGHDSTAVEMFCDAVAAGESAKAIQIYAQISYKYYFAQKHDDGLLYVDLSANGVPVIYFENLAQLHSFGHRLHADTVYLNAKDLRLPYPQMKVVPTKHQH